MRLGLVFAPHNEHLLAVPRSLVLALHALTGGVDFPVLNLLGNAYLLLLLAALFVGFQPGARPPRRLLAFAPAALLLLQPQYWSALIWPTTSLSNFGVVAWAATAFSALARPSRAAFGLAAVAAVAAVFSQGNGFLVLLLGGLVPWLRGQPRRAAAWLLFALVLLIAYVALQEAGSAAGDLRHNVGQPLRAAHYALALAGCAGGFSVPGLSTAVGLALLASFAALIACGLPRRNPMLFALLLFVFASIAANALVRAHQGAGTALVQPRYRFYASALLAASTLAWTELLAGRRAARLWVAASLALSAAFCAGSYQLYRHEVVALSGRLEEGLERWWSTGETGLAHPDFRKASFYLLQSYGRGLLQLPPELVERYARVPATRAAAPEDRSLRRGIHALQRDGDVLLVAGWVHADGASRGQEVELVLLAPAGIYAVPALSVVRADLPEERRDLRARIGRSGFHALVRIDELPPARYRLGVLLRGGGKERFGSLPGTLELGPPRT